MYHSMPELYDTLYQENRQKMSEYYTVNRVHKLGEYAILSLANNYKYNILPHYLVRGGRSEFLVLDTLRHLRTSFFFGLPSFIDLLNQYLELTDLVIIFINSN